MRPSFLRVPMYVMGIPLESAISISGRITTGVKIIDLEEDVKVASFTRVKEDPDPEDAEETGENSVEAEDSEGFEESEDPEEDAESEE